MKRHTRVAPLGGIAALLLVPSGLAAQGYTAEASVHGSVIELRGLVRDSLPESAVPGAGLNRTLDDGTRVRCIPEEFCRWYPSGEEESVSLVTQNLRLSAWPGIQGLAAHVHVRGRYGSDDFWPRTEQEVEAVYAYASYQWSDYRVRAGRQHRVNGLGYYNFDGAAFQWRGLEPLTVEAYGGWSLARNLNAPRTGTLLEEADEFAPDERGLLFGVDVRGGWGRRMTGAFTYQREIRSDELALYTERVAGDLGLRLDRVSIELAADYDLAFEEFNEASVRISAPLVAGFDVMGQVRRYTPHFELWTIWGAFDPVGYDETRAWLGWTSPDGALRLEGGGARRTYEETEAGAAFARLEDDGWRAFGRAHYRWNAWFVEGSYHAEEGSGAARYDGDLRVGRRFGDDRWVSVHGTSSQSFSEFRAGDQVTAGGGVNVGWRIGDATLTGAWSAYDLTYEGRPSTEDWTQVRGHLGISYRFGTEPGSRSAIGRGGYR